jgi:hypothetical protein
VDTGLFITVLDKKEVLPPSAEFGKGDFLG